MKKFLVNGWTYDKDKKPVSDTYPLIAKEFDTLKDAQTYHREIIRLHKAGRFINVLGDNIYHVCLDLNYLYTIDEKSMKL